MFALRAAHAYDGHRFLPGGATVVVQDGRIAGVEPLAHDLPADCPVTTYEGTLLPGLVDTHVHLTCDATMTALAKVAEYGPDELESVMSDSLARQAASGVTTVRDLGDRDYCTLDRRSRLGTLEPRIAVAGPPLTVPDGHCHFLGGVVLGEEGIRAAVAERVERGVDVVKVMVTGGMLTPGTDVFGTQFSEAELRCLVETAHDAGLPVLAHAHSLAGVRMAVDTGVDGLEHFTCLTPEGRVVPDDLPKAVAARGMTVCLTLGFDPAVLEQLPKLPPGLQAALDRLGLTREEALGGQIRTIAPLLEAGVRIVDGIDAGVTPPKRHGNAWRAVLDLVTGGMPVADALAAATSVGADACGFGAVTGRLTPGYDADLLVVDGDLAHDPAALGRVQCVVVRGTTLAA